MMCANHCAAGTRQPRILYPAKETYAPTAPTAPTFSTRFLASHNHMKLLTYSRISPIGRVVVHIVPVKRVEKVGAVGAPQRWHASEWCRQTAQHWARKAITNLDPHPQDGVRLGRGCTIPMGNRADRHRAKRDSGQADRVRPVPFPDLTVTP